MKKFLAGACLLFIAFVSEAQTRYLVRFKDKATSPFSLSNPSQYLSPRAIARRTAYNIALDSTDLPVTPRYVDSVRLAGAVTILNVSRWLNQVSIQTTDANALAKINSLPFVLSAQPIAARQNGSGQSGSQAKKARSKKQKPQSLRNTTADFYNYGLSYNQVRIHNGEFLHNIGLRGQNMIISMLDAGYFNYTNLRAFDSVNANGQVLGTWDFVNREASVVEDNAHGMQCFSVIAANVPGQFVGTAPKASFYLFRSEEAATEYPIEEHNWVCAAERADSTGSDVISSSLGYNTFDGAFNNSTYNHTYAQMNGNTTMAAIAADLAAKKGLVVLNAAGNEGNNGWKFIITPADADSILAVGAVNTSGQVANFSSYGPSSDGQVKPDVASVGWGTVIQGSSNNITTSNGTSFACPNMAGLVTCLWQGFPEFNNMKIVQVVRQVGSIATTPNDRIGFGIPDMKKAVMILVKEFSSATASVSNCKTTLVWNSKDVASMKYEIERKLPSDLNYIKIGERSGTGSVFGSRSYQFTDSLVNTSAGTISYRIRQVLDTSAGGFMADYIDTATLSLTTTCNGTAGNTEQVRVAPNPSAGNFTIQLFMQEPIPQLNLRLFNSNGQLVWQRVESKPAGTYALPLQVPQLAPGKYTLMLYNSQQLVATKELIKL